MEEKEAKEIAINLVHIADLIEILENEIGSVRETLLHGQVLLARRSYNNISKMIGFYLKKEG